MTPKEKARELVEKYFYLFSVELENTIADYEAKECALIAVDEIWRAVQFLDDETEDFWLDVKIEIEKL